jgi:hypothetical protein
MGEDSNTYYLSGVADNFSMYPHGDKAKSNATYCHGSMAKDNAMYCCGGTATRMPNICVILKNNLQIQSCDIVLFCQ